MSAALALGVEYLAGTQLPSKADAWWQGVLGVAQFGRPLLESAPGELPVAQIPMSPIHGGDSVCEIWRATGPICTGSLGAVQYRASAEMLFGCIAIPEGSASAQGGNPDHGALGGATTRAYADIFRVLDATGFPQLARVWNYVPAINQAVGEGERYWQFNSARQEVFLARREAIDGTVPAASALGTPGGSPLVVYFLASTAGLHMLENPRQLSAYRYPRQYGPCSPAFSRAALLTGALGCPLLVSGTASIVGHESVHTDDVTAQTRETLANIRALVLEANDVLGVRRFEIERLAYKVYVRHASDLPAIAAELRATIGDTRHIAFLQAEVCRRDLLVEIEAVGCAAGAAARGPDPPRRRAS